MEKHRKEQITNMTLEDIAEIDSWQAQFAGSKNYESIQRYLTHENFELADSSLTSETPRNVSSLTDVIDEYFVTKVSDPNYDPVEEDFLAYVMKNEQGKIVLFSIFNFRDLISHHNPVCINALVVHPEEQNKGYAKKFLTEVFENQARFFGWEPSEFYTSFAADNEPAKKLFSRFGFNITQSENFASAQTYAPKLASESQPGSDE